MSFTWSGWNDCAVFARRRVVWLARKRKKVESDEEKRRGEFNRAMNNPLISSQAPLKEKISLKSINFPSLASCPLQNLFIISILHRLYCSLFASCFAVFSFSSTISRNYLNERPPRCERKIPWKSRRVSWKTGEATHLMLFHLFRVGYSFEYWDLWCVGVDGWAAIYLHLKLKIAKVFVRMRLMVKHLMIENSRFTRREVK